MSEQEHIEQHRQLLYVAERGTRTAYAKEVPDERVPLAEAVGDSPLAELLRDPKKGSEPLCVDSAFRVDTKSALGLGPPGTWMSRQLGPSRVVREVVGVDAVSSAQHGTILRPPFQIRPGRSGSGSPI